MIGEWRVTGEMFTWSSDRAQLTVTQEGDWWSVICRTVSPLLGPPQVTHQARHRLPKLAAWDVWARVNRVSDDDEEGVVVAQQAARWMCSMMWPANGHPPPV